MDFLHKILTDLDQITDSDLDAGLKRLNPREPEDKLIGTSESIAARRLLVLSFKYQKLSLKLLHDWYGLPDEGARVIRAQHEEMDGLSDIAKDLAWLEIKRELGPVVWEAGCDSLGIREGYQVVGIREASAPPPDMKLLGAINVTDIMREALREMAKNSAASPFRSKREEEKPS